MVAFEWVKRSMTTEVTLRSSTKKILNIYKNIKDPIQLQDVQEFAKNDQGNILEQELSQPPGIFDNKQIVILRNQAFIVFFDY